MVIFLDEIDGLCKKRVGSLSDNFREQERAVTLNQLLVEMDGFNTYANKGILLIGATNNPEDLDPALTRPGRMDRIIEMPLPDLEGRVEIMTLYNKGWQFLGPIDLHEVRLSPALVANSRSLAGKAGNQEFGSLCYCASKSAPSGNIHRN